MVGVPPEMHTNTPLSRQNSSVVLGVIQRTNQNSERRELPVGSKVNKNTTLGEASVGS